MKGFKMASGKGNANGRISNALRVIMEILLEDWSVNFAHVL